MKYIALILLFVTLLPAALAAQVQATAEDNQGTWTPADSELLDYRAWYPFHRSQARGQRSLHWWHNQGLGDDTLRGQSTFRYETQPPDSTLPTSYDGQTVEYYLQWYCEQFQVDRFGNKTYDSDPECKKLAGRWLEVQSEHRRSNKTVALLSWGFGREDSWSIFFAPGTFTSCTTNVVSSALQAQPGLKTNPALRMPLQWYAPVAESTMSHYVEVYGPVVCEVVFDDYEMTNVLKAREKFISATREDYQSAAERPDGRPVQLVINRYFQRCTNASCSDSFCLSASDIDANLEAMPGDPAIRPHLYQTVKVRGGVSYCASQYEPFWTRKTAVVNGVRHHGMGAWDIFGKGWASSALDRNYTLDNGQVFCENAFVLPWEGPTAWNNYVACAHDPTDGDDAP